MTLTMCSAILKASNRRAKDSSIVRLVITLSQKLLCCSFEYDGEAYITYASLRKETILSAIFGQLNPIG